MTSISSVSSVQAALRAGAAPAGTDARAASARTGAGVAPSSIVRLSAAGLARQADAGDAPARVSTASRFSGLGASMLAAFAAGKAAPVGQAPLPADAENRFSLNVVTASGKQLALSLGNRGEEMFFSIESDAVLGDAEREALAALAQGFQDAIDGMAQDEPAIRIAGLASLDTSLFESIGFASKVTLPTQPPERMSFDFHIDAQQRTVSIDGPRGKIDLGVDTSRPELLGSRQQQDKAIDRYLKQVDQAAQRGHGDAQLVALFKDAFAGISRTEVQADDAQAAPVSPGRWALARQDHAVLTGLSDFHASIEQTVQQINPARREEVDSFRYALSQATSLRGDAYPERAISQQQTSRLSAQFHEALTPGAKLALDFRPESQNYRYRQIDDAASSKVDLGYKAGRLQVASLEQSVQQSERVRSYALGRLVSDKTVPREHVLVRDLMGALAPRQPREDGGSGDESREMDEGRRRLLLEALSDEVALAGTWLELTQRDRRLAERLHGWGQVWQSDTNSAIGRPTT